MNSSVTCFLEIWCQKGKEVVIERATSSASHPRTSPKTHRWVLLFFCQVLLTEACSDPTCLCCGRLAVSSGHTATALKSPFKFKKKSTMMITMVELRTSLLFSLNFVAVSEYSKVRGYVLYSRRKKMHGVKKKKGRNLVLFYNVPQDPEVCFGSFI